jgi:hypothetical protein
MASQALRTWEKACTLLNRAADEPEKLTQRYTREFTALALSVYKQSSAAAAVKKLAQSQVGHPSSDCMDNICALYEASYGWTPYMLLMPIPKQHKQTGQHLCCVQHQELLAAPYPTAVHAPCCLFGIPCTRSFPYDCGRFAAALLSHRALRRFSLLGTLH